jgi:hypothetical protein
VKWAVPLGQQGYQLQLQGQSSPPPVRPSTREL